MKKVTRTEILDYARRIGVRGLGTFKAKDLTSDGRKIAQHLRHLADLLDAYVADRSALDGSPR